MEGKGNCRRREKEKIYMFSYAFLYYSYKGWYAGYQAGYEINSAKMTANNISLGYRGDGYTVHSSW